MQLISNLHNSNSLEHNRQNTFFNKYNTIRIVHKSIKTQSTSSLGRDSLQLSDEYKDPSPQKSPTNQSLNSKQKKLLLFFIIFINLSIGSLIFNGTLVTALLTSLLLLITFFTYSINPRFFIS